MASASLSALYNAAPLNLWVEDPTTRAYLEALWGPSTRLALHVGGGSETISAVVEDAWRSGHRHVFALRDRDFGKTNRPRWTSPDERLFKLETFEVECFLLDPAALAGSALNTAGRTEAQLRQRLDELATEHLWWMATRRALVQMRDRSNQGFPRHPKRSQVTTRPDGEAWLRDNDWARSTLPGLTGSLTAGAVTALLTQAHAHYAALVTGGVEAWAPAFSGKELFRDLIAWVWTKGRPKGMAAEEDLAKAVAHEQRRAGTQPPELIELRDAILARLP